MERSPTRASDRHEIHLGHCLNKMRELDACSIDAVVTDPPYAIDSTGREVDLEERAMLGMQSRNWNEKATHSRGYADHDPRQFQEWCEQWLREVHRILKPGAHIVSFGGTRTWHRLAAAAEDSGLEIRDTIAWIHATGRPKTTDLSRTSADLPVEDLGRVRGRSTTLSPAFEPAVLARKPLTGTVVENVLAHGTGALNIDACRTPAGSGEDRWPSNGVLDPQMLLALDDQFERSLYPALRVAKPSQKERVCVDGVTHPTVKPLDLIRFLIRLITPPDGIVLDPFAGSGSTAEAALLEGVRSISIERDDAYIPLIEARLARRLEPARMRPARSDELTLPL